jgi:hypothetical protein
MKSKLRTGCEQTDKLHEEFDVLEYSKGSEAVFHVLTVVVVCIPIQ